MFDLGETTKQQNQLFFVALCRIPARIEFVNPSSGILDPCETGTHLCHELAVCSFDGVNYKCICESHMHGNGIYCSGH